MPAMRLRQPVGLENLYVAQSDVKPPGLREIQVRVHASSLNRHDFLVVADQIQTRDESISLSDGAGEVVAVGSEVDEFVVGDHVISTFNER